MYLLDYSTRTQPQISWLRHQISSQHTKLYLLQRVFGTNLFVKAKQRVSQSSKLLLRSSFRGEWPKCASGKPLPQTANSSKLCKNLEVIITYGYTLMVWMLYNPYMFPSTSAALHKLDMYQLGYHRVTLKSQEFFLWSWSSL